MSAPKFEKKRHHVVAAGWQRRFFFRDAAGAIGRTGYYKDIQQGRMIGPEGPGVAAPTDRSMLYSFWTLARPAGAGTGSLQPQQRREAHPGHVLQKSPGIGRLGIVEAGCGNVAPISRPRAPLRGA
jgi:hypothetical protein